MKKRICLPRRGLLSAFVWLIGLTCSAQGWPAEYGGVMLQAFYWDSYADTNWSVLEAESEDIGEFFSLVWLPPSASCGTGTSMGYNPLYWISDYRSSFGREQELRSLIKSLSAAGVSVLADVVVNHHASSAGTWMTFPEETYEGLSMTLTQADICSDDDGGETKIEAEVPPTGALDTGDDFLGYRDIDHTSSHAQAVVTAYLDFLLNNLGYTGFRYDMAKGFDPYFITLYNTSVQPLFSVGEYWDTDINKLRAWLDGTQSDGVTMSAAFDFVLKDKLTTACNGATGWSSLSQQSLISTPDYRQYAVTFVDNHDTYDRNTSDEVTQNILAANAFLLAAPGTPCIFLPHWQAYTEPIKQMIYGRKAAGVHNQSTYSILFNGSQQYAIEVSGSQGSTVIILGNQDIPSALDIDNYFLVESGENFSFYISRTSQTAWANKPSGTYDSPFDITLTAVSDNDQTTLVYTLDGSQPSPTNGTQVDDSAVLTIDSDTELNAALLIDGQIVGQITRQYRVETFLPHDISVYFKADWDNIYYHMWDSQGSSTVWPGALADSLVVRDNALWAVKTYPIPAADYFINLVFDAGSNARQTVDVLHINQDTYFELDTETDPNGHFYVNKVSSPDADGISAPHADRQQATVDNSVYTLSGQKISPTAVQNNGIRGVVIRNGKKIVTH